MLFKKKKYIVSIFLTGLMVFYTHISGYADENNDPVFIDGNRTIRTIAENTPAGVNIGAPVAATDADNDTLTYNKGWVDGAAFSIDTATGQIQTKAPLDYETKNIYHFNVFVDDGNGGRSVILVTINVTDVAETPVNTAPLFTDGTSTTRSVSENTAAGANIGTAISATDADNDTLTYSLGGTDASAFSIVSTSGQLQRRAALDYETKTSYSVTVSVSDGNGGSGSIAVTVNVTDVNEVPSFPTETATLSVAENTASGTNIGAPFQATDPDSGDILTYSLHRGDAGAFRIDPITGQLRTHAALDFETKQVYNNLAIRATDSKGSFDAIFVTVTVTNVNEKPNFPTETAARTIAENTASGTNLGAPFQATDPDSGDTLTYSLHRGDASAFRINPTTGQLRTHAALDFETKQVYNNLAIRATDSKGSFDAIFVTINVTDVDENRAPAFSEGNSTTRSIAENTASGTNIGTAIAATDPDTGDTLTYSLGGTDASAFGIVSTSGQLQTNAALDYETKTSYAVTVSVSDGNGGGDSISVIINVTDVNENRAPGFSEGNSTTRSVAENTASGANIGSAVSATDADNDTLTYSLGGTDAASFRIVSTSGQLQRRAALDYETKSSYSVSVSVSDGNGGSDSISVTVTVTNVNEKPNFPTETATRSIAENTARGTNLGAPFQATDPDSRDTLTYSLHRGDASAFRINPTTGQLRTHAALDFETKQVYNNLAIRATDSNGKFDAIFVTINVTDVNENRAPAFTDGNSTTRSIAENTASGVNIGAAVSATDADTGDTLTYTLSGVDAASFSIVSTSGQLQTKAALDYETKASYSVSVSVSDGNGGNDSISVSINVTDVDENRAPAFTDGTSTTRSVAENTASGTNIGTAIAATDSDTGDTLTYTLGGTDASAFSIVSTSGQLQRRAALDYETKSSYSVTVSVSDGNGGSDSITVTISVTDVNDKPRFPTETATVSVAENTTSGTNIGAPFQATDPDSGDTLTYSLHRGDARAFRIDPTTGQLRTHMALDFETKKVYDNLAIRVTDSKGSFHAIFVTINVTDVDENRAPAFTDGASTTRSVAENTASGVNIGTAIAATDADTDDTLTYSLGGTDASSFSIVSTSGQLQTKTALDYETKSSYSVTVSVSDSNGGSDSISVSINVTDVNENRAPVFSDGTNTTRSIAENTASGVNIESAISATDADNDTLTYTLGGTDAASFRIVSTSGQLQTSAALNYEIKSSYAVSVSVSDGNGGSDSISVTINVTDVVEGIIDPPLSERTPQVRDAIVREAGVSKVSHVTLSHLAEIESLDVSARSVDSLKAGDFAGLTNLKTLNLSQNSVSDLSPLSGLTNLTLLNLMDTSVSDLSPLSGLTKLETLNLIDTSVSDLSPLSGLTKLRSLYLSGTSISDLSPLSGLTKLRSLYLSGISISDLSPLSGLTNLETLSLNGISISNIFHLSGLTNLESLYLGGTSISDLSPLSGLTSLTYLRLVNNSITDFSPIHRLKAAIEVIEGHPGLTLDITIPAVSNSNVPVFSEGDSTTRSIAENAAAGTNIGTAVSATDADAGDILTYHLGGTDAASFSIVRTSGQLQTKTELDYETKDAYTVAIAVSDGKGGSDSITVTIDVTDVEVEGEAAAPSVQTPPVLPETTALLSNFPNPFNPETWIPYQLAEPAEVTLTIYDVRGRVVRTLRLGNQPAGLYRSRSKAVYWDGRNHLGEKVATGIYFYTLKAGDYAATRKLLIRK